VVGRAAGPVRAHEVAGRTDWSEFQVGPFSPLADELQPREGDRSERIAARLASAFLCLLAEEQTRTWVVVDGGSPMGRMVSRAESHAGVDEEAYRWVRDHDLVEVKVSAYDQDTWEFLPSSQAFHWASYLAESPDRRDCRRFIDLLWTWGFALLYPLEDSDMAELGDTLNGLETPALADEAVLSYCHTEVLTGEDQEVFRVLSVLADADQRVQHAVAEVNGLFRDLVGA